MQASIVARNYAEALLELAKRHGGDAAIDAYGESIVSLAALLRENPRVREFLATPRIDVQAKKAVLKRALEGRAPDHFVRFVGVVVEKRRADRLSEIAAAYGALVDEVRGRVRAEVVLAYEADAALRQEITDSLERMLKRTVIAEFRADANLLGGIVIRVGDQILDGSIRRRAGRLRHRLLSTQLPAGAGA